jgi:hypothetical protein
VSPLIKEGSAIRPNANGTVIYAAVNGALSVGRIPDEVPKVETTPAVFKLQDTENDMFDYVKEQFQQFYQDTDFSRLPGSIATASKELFENAGDLAAPYENSKLTVTARLPLQPAPPTSVTVDLSRFGGSSETPMVDDGQHGEGAAGDGVYGIAFSFQPQNHPSTANEWRSVPPGPVAFGVTATYADGRRQGAVGVVGVYRLLKDFDLWNRNGTDINAATDGAIKARPVYNPAIVHKGSQALRLDADKGGWSVTLSLTRSMQDLTSYGAFSFWMKAGGGEPPKELYLQLRDEPEFSEPTTTAAVMVPNVKIGSDYQRIVAPLDELLGSNPQFQTGRVRKIIISGTTSGPVTLYFDRPRMLGSGDTSDSDDEGSKK